MCPWLGTKSHEQGWSPIFRARVYVRNGQEVWVLGSGCHIKALEIPPPSGQDWAVRIWLGCACCRRSGGVTRAWEEMWRRGTRARAGSVSEVLPLSPGFLAKASLLPWQGWRKLAHIPSTVPKALLFTSSAFIQRILAEDWGQVAELADLMCYYGPAAVIIFSLYFQYFLERVILQMQIC